MALVVFSTYRFVLPAGLHTGVLIAVVLVCTGVLMAAVLVWKNDDHTLTLGWFLVALMVSFVLVGAMEGSFAVIIFAFFYTFPCMLGIGAALALRNAYRSRKPEQKPAAEESASLDE